MPFSVCEPLCMCSCICEDVLNFSRKSQNLTGMASRRKKESQPSWKHTIVVKMGEYNTQYCNFGPSNKHNIICCIFSFNNYLFNPNLVTIIWGLNSCMGMFYLSAVARISYHISNWLSNWHVLLKCCLQLYLIMCCASQASFMQKPLCSKLYFGCYCSQMRYWDDFQIFSVITFY